MSKKCILAFIHTFSYYPQIGFCFIDLKIYAALAQLVEHIIRNDGVAGSNPACGTVLLYLTKYIDFLFNSLFLDHLLVHPLKFIRFYLICYYLLRIFL